MSKTTTTTKSTTSTMADHIETSLYLHAKALGASNDIAGLEELFKTVGSTDKQHFVDMVLIGACETKSKESGSWALKHGACELWSIQQEPNQWHRVGNDSNKGLKMLGGPGEVKKGTFVGLSSSSSSSK